MKRDVGITNSTPSHLGEIRFCPRKVINSKWEIKTKNIIEKEWINYPFRPLPGLGIAGRFWVFFSTPEVDDVQS